MRKLKTLSAGAAILCIWLTSGQAFAAECRTVENDPKIDINPLSLRVFERAGLPRPIIFDYLVSVSKVETSGCWAGITGNFDGQLASVGVLQWNYGQNSIQPLLKAFKKKLRTSSALRRDFTRNAPKFGELVLSDRCLKRTSVSQIRKLMHPCQKEFMASRDGSESKLDPTFEKEMKWIFETDAMLQVQADSAFGLMDKSIDFIQRLFDKTRVSDREFHFMFDTIVHAGGFGDLESFKSDAERGFRRGLADGEKSKRAAMKGILLWYAGHAFSPDQDGIKCDWRYNLERWGDRVANGAVSDIEYKLFMMSWLRARYTSGQRGRWQALAFQRRAKIALNDGSVAHRSVTRDNNYPCERPTPEQFSSVVERISNI